MNISHYIGFDVHKKHINFCIKTADGTVVEEGKLLAQRAALRNWAAQQVSAWHGAMEATLFSAWIYDTLKPYAACLEMAHPFMLKAIAASKKKNDILDARKIADLVRCHLLPACYVASPQIRELRRLLRYRNLVVRESVRMQNKIAGPADGIGRTLSQTEAARQKIFRATARHPRGSAGLGERPAALEPQRHGNVSSHPETAARRVAGPSRLASASGATGQHSRCGSGHGIDLGIGGRRPLSLLRFGAGHELLRPDLGLEIFRRQTATRAHFQTAQPLAANCVDRSRQTGAALEPATGRAACPRVGTRASQPRHSRRGPQAGRLSVGGGQKRSTVSTASARSSHRARSAASQLRKSCDYYCEVVSDLPAVLRRLGDW